MARPTKLNKKVQERIVTAIRNGATRFAAAGAGGINASTFYDWLARGEREKGSVFSEFSDAVRKAESQAAFRVEMVVTKAIQDGEWKAAIEWLRRRRPQDWTDKGKIDVVSSDGSMSPTPTQVNIVGVKSESDVDIDE